MRNGCREHVLALFFLSARACTYLLHPMSTRVLLIPRIYKWRISPPSTPLRRMASLPAHLVNPVRGMEWAGLDSCFSRAESSASRELVIAINGVYVCMYNACNQSIVCRVVQSGVHDVRERCVPVFSCSRGSHVIRTPACNTTTRVSTPLHSFPPHHLHYHRLCSQHTIPPLPPPYPASDPQFCSQNTLPHPTARCHELHRPPAPSSNSPSCLRPRHLTTAYPHQAHQIDHCSHILHALWDLLFD